MKKDNKSFSRYSLEAVALLGQQIKIARIENKFTVQEIAERGGISRGLVQRIERGAMTCAIGTVFEVATIVGIKLFDADVDDLKRNHHQAEERIALLPKSVRLKNDEVDDDF